MFKVSDPCCRVALWKVAPHLQLRELGLPVPIEAALDEVVSMPSMVSSNHPNPNWLKLKGDSLADVPGGSQLHCVRFLLSPISLQLPGGCRWWDSSFIPREREFSPTTIDRIPSDWLVRPGSPNTGDGVSGPVTLMGTTSQGAPYEWSGAPAHPGHSVAQSSKGTSWALAR